MSTGRRGGRRRLFALPVVLALVSCTNGPSEPLGFETASPPWATSASVTPVPGAEADFYVVHDDDMEGFDSTKLRPGQPATDTALASHVRLPGGVYDIARLGNRLLAMTDKGKVMLVDPSTGKVEQEITVAPAMLGEQTFTSLILDETESTPDRATAYVAGRFARPNQRAFVGFVLGLDARLTITTTRKFADDIVQDLAADELGAVALLTSGLVADAVTGETLRKPDYERASSAIAVRRTKAGLWIAVGNRDNGGNTKPFVLTPDGPIELPAAEASPILLNPIPEGVAVICQSVDAVYVVSGKTLRTVTVPQSGAGAVLLGEALYVLSAGSDRLTRIDLSDLSTDEFVMPSVSTLIA